MIASVYTLTATAQVSKKLPEDAQALLNSLPGKALTVELVVSKAFQVSDSFQSVQALEPAISVPRLQSAALVDPQGFVRASKTDDQRQPQIAAFQARRTQREEIALGVSSQTITGTMLSAEVSHGRTELNFQSIPNLKYFETVGTLSVTQSLVKNAFGAGTRQGLSAGRFLEESKLHDYNESIEQWALGLLELYYNAWLSMAQARISESALQRRERLLKVTELKQTRGTAETPDVLQVQTAVKNSQVQFELSEQSLSDRWRMLAVTLKLPESWLSISPRDIPMSLDEPIQRAEEFCAQTDHEDSTSTKRARSYAKASESLLNQSKWNQIWDLQLKGSVFANRIDPVARQSISQWGSLQYPGYQIGLELKFPFSADAEKAELRQTFSDATRASALMSQSISSQKVEWMNQCMELARLQRARSLFEKAFHSENNRVNLELERFKLGRAATMNVIQAEDDASSAELNWVRSQVELRMASWKIIRLSGQMRPLLEKSILAGGQS